MLPSFNSLSLSLVVATIATAQITKPTAPDVVKQDHAEQVSQDPSSTPCQLACAHIAETIPHAFFLRDESVATFWDAKQSDLIAACRIEPATAEEVSVVLKAAIKEQCHFAIRGGGHSRIAGSSNAENGITIDLKRFNFVELAKDQTTVRIGGGSVWGKVYKTLEKQGLTVVGGRVADVGVGGLTLGGGISFLSNRYGWACDSVTAFEVVLPDTSTQTITKDSNADVFWALRGGGNNFGVVTAFHFDTVKRNPEIWRGNRVYTLDKIPELVAAQHRFVTKVQAGDPDAVGWFAYGYHAQYDMLIAVPSFFHLKHTSNTTWPAAFKDFESIEGLPDSTALVYKPLSEATEDAEALNPYGMRSIYKSITYKSSPQVDQQILEIYQKEVQPMKHLVGTVPFIVFHPTPIGHIAHMAKNGGNALGLSGSGPLTIMQTAWMWHDKADDEVAYLANNRIIEKATEAARKAGVLVQYIYQNYAWEDQDVYAGYGRDNQARLKEIQKRIDPEGVFAGGAGLCRGYFKVNTKKSSFTEERSNERDEL